jgi:ABC-2 type transport system permease protein
MNLDRSLVIAKKDLSEFRKNRYIMMTLFIMPLMVSIALPIVYVVPINELSRQNAEDVALTFNITAEFNNVAISNMTLADARLERVNITNCVLSGCIIGNSSATKSVFTSCQIRDTILGDSLIYGGRLINIHDGGGNTIRDSFFVGGNKQLEDLKGVMFNVLLILLIMIPVTIPTVTASYSFVGEKMNKSLEPLLATPITDVELLLGKSLSIFGISMAATWTSFLIASGVVDFLAGPVLGYYPLPSPYWIVGMVLLAPGMCMMSILANVLISSKVNDVRVSQQIGGVLVLPIILFFILSLSGFLSSGLLSIFLFSAMVFGIDGGILWLSLKVFKREEILVSWK